MNCVYICVQNKLRLRWLWNHLQPLTLAKLFGPHIIKKHHSSWWPIAIALLTYTMGCQETSQGKLWKLWSLKVHHIQPNLILPLVNWGESINQRYPYLNERWTPQNSHVVEVAAQLQPVVAVTGGIGRCIHCCSTLRYLASEKVTHSAAFSQGQKVIQAYTGGFYLHIWHKFSYFYHCNMITVAFSLEILSPS